MKKLIALLSTLAFTVIGVNTSTQTNTTTNFIKGTLNITYNTHQNPAGTKGIQDVYDININVTNSVLFHGKMTDRTRLLTVGLARPSFNPVR